jgi:hypothetical protein
MPSSDNIRRLHSAPSWSEFLAIAQEPFLIEGFFKSSEAYRRWSPEFFVSHYGHLEVPVYPQGQDCIEMPLKAYFEEYFLKGRSDYYLKDWVFELDAPALRTQYNIPEVFASYFDELPFAEQPLLHWFYIGPKGSGSALHIDIWHTAAWNGVLSGRKEWHFYPPEATPYLYDLQIDSFRADKERYPLLVHTKPIVAHQEAGDLVYTPSQWAHQVRNLEGGVSITENFVNTSNIKAVSAYFDTQPDNRYGAALRSLLQAKQNIAY